MSCNCIEKNIESAPGILKVHNSTTPTPPPPTALKKRRIGHALLKLLRRPCTITINKILSDLFVKKQITIKF